MARFNDVIGFVTLSDESETGVYKEVPTERTYKGDVLRNVIRNETGPKVNDDATISNQISIISDDYSLENYAYIKYVKWMGIRWRVVSIEVRRPRLILTLGNVYNGN